MAIQHEVLIVGTGLAGLMAAMECCGKVDTGVISKVFPTRAHSVAAQGGIAAALGNVSDDTPEIHMYDTVKGSDFLGDQDVIEIMCEDAPRAIIELEHLGVPFSRLDNGKINQRPFGGHTHARAAFAADRTGHVVMHTLYGQCLRHNVNFYSEYFVTELLVENGRCCGLVAYDIVNGEFHTFQAKAVLFATGGCGQVFRSTSNCQGLTGDGMVLAFRAGVPLEDMERFGYTEEELMRGVVNQPFKA
ncbi:MAG: FAD-binding protein, partial [Nitrospinota bacterium]